MKSVRTICIITLVLGATLFITECFGQRNPRRRQRNRSQTRGSEGLPSDVEQAYLSAVDGQDDPMLQPNENEDIGSESIRSATSNPWDLYVPSTPAAYDVECSVEVITRRRQGGRCTRLGGSFMPFICQSGAHFEFNRDCARIMGERRQPDS